MTENNNENERPVVGLNVGSVILTDGSEWGSEEITDLRNKYVEQEAEVTRLREAVSRRLRQFTDLQHRTRDAFRELVDDEDLDIDKANEVLEDLGLEMLAVEWEWEVTVEIRGTGKAPTDSALHDALEQATFEVEAYADDVEDIEVVDADVTSVSSSRAV